MAVGPQIRTLDLIIVLHREKVLVGLKITGDKEKSAERSSIYNLINDLRLIKLYCRKHALEDFRLESFLRERLLHSQRFSLNTFS